MAAFSNWDNSQFTPKETPLCCEIGLFLNSAQLRIKADQGRRNTLGAPQTRVCTVFPCAQIWQLFGDTIWPWFGLTSLHFQIGTIHNSGLRQRRCAVKLAYF
jgi:hypothetical protein